VEVDPDADFPKQIGDKIETSHRDPTGDDQQIRSKAAKESTADQIDAIVDDAEVADPADADLLQRDPDDQVVCGSYLRLPRSHVGWNQLMTGDENGDLRFGVDLHGGSADRAEDDEIPLP
jgi:hypothetical protein